MIGERTVEGRVDKDAIDVNNAAGNRYTKLTVVVLDSDLVMNEMHMYYKSGKHHEADTISNFAFREGSRTRVINLPSELLQRVTFRYSNLPGGGRARIQLWGWQDGQRPPVGGGGAPINGGGAVQPPPPPPGGGAWAQIGERDVAAKTGEATIDVKQAASKIQLAVVGGDVEIIELKIMMKSGKNRVTDVKGAMKAGERSQEISIASEQLTRVHVKYKNLSGAKAKIQLFAMP